MGHIIVNKFWTHEEARTLAVLVEAVAPANSCHVALTGGCLYKFGPRKDLDLLFYRIRQSPKIDMDGLWRDLGELGIKKISGFGWCYKAEYNGKGIDCFFPEEQDGEYGKPQDQQSSVS